MKDLIYNLKVGLLIIVGVITTVAGLYIFVIKPTGYCFDNSVYYTESVRYELVKKESYTSYGRNSSSVNNVFIVRDLQTNELSSREVDRVTAYKLKEGDIITFSEQQKNGYWIILGILSSIVGFAFLVAVVNSLVTYLAKKLRV